MNKEVKENLYSFWFNVVHYIFIAIFLILIVVLPILYTQTGTPPYWTIWLIFGVLFIVYIIYWVILLIYKRSILLTLDNEGTNNNNDHIINMPAPFQQDEIIGLQQPNNTSIEEEIDNNTLETSYNPSTVGIPPSSFLAPTIHQQASIRSSSLDYTPPPPAYYHDMIYPPSYRSTNSTKDDNVSAIHSINNNNNM